MNETASSSSLRLNAFLANAGQAPLDERRTKSFEDYLSLVLHWNVRVNLTAIRDVEGIVTRHFVESITCARLLPVGIHTLLDFGSGAGFPGIPVALCRPEISVTLAESQGKKAAFLQEAVRVLGIVAKVHSGRAEALRELFDCVALRAVDRMEFAVQAAAQIVRPGGCLALMTTGNVGDAQRAAAGAEFSWTQFRPLPGSDDRLLALGTRDSGSALQ
jgi:16S rRNA (guanine527-N7)-methyltransferase